MHAYSESGELKTSNDADASSRCCIGTYVPFVRWSCSTRWRCANVPRSTSWPVRRIGIPSPSRDAAALELLRKLRMDLEIGGHAQQLFVQLRERVRADRGDDVAARRARGDRAVVLVLRALGERRLQPVVGGAQRLLDLLHEAVG